MSDYTNPVSDEDPLEEALEEMLEEADGPTPGDDLSTDEVVEDVEELLAEDGLSPTDPQTAEVLAEVESDVSEAHAIFDPSQDVGF